MKRERSSGVFRSLPPPLNFPQPSRVSPSPTGQAFVIRLLRSGSGEWRSDLLRIDPMSANLEEDIQEKLHRLPNDKQRAVLEFIEGLEPQGREQQSRSPT